ncbi:hypothetical protein DY000_02038258 [Brassica cretica]|uniref:Uncharacterized protein n=1 Tax=Brassica cretica TaxID=69181 RepID=A0ABQ7BKN8_BRACR|nr:hypothetical protein DY000_02038258 [Brassica cretica]
MTVETSVSSKKAELLPCNEANEWGDDDDDDWNDGWETLEKPVEVLLEDIEAESLTGILARSGPFLALNISLLLPEP